MDMYMFLYSYAYDKKICKEPQLCICIKVVTEKKLKQDKAKSKKALECPRDTEYFSYKWQW